MEQRHDLTSLPETYDSGHRRMQGRRFKSQNGITQFGMYGFPMAKSLHTPEYEFFRLLLVGARENAGLTQTEVATKIGHPQSFVAKYEGGERRLDVVEFIQVCSALGVDPHEVLRKLQDKVSA